MNRKSIRSFKISQSTKIKGTELREGSSKEIPRHSGLMSTENNWYRNREVTKPPITTTTLPVEIPHTRPPTREAAHNAKTKELIELRSAEGKAKDRLKKELVSSHAIRFFHVENRRGYRTIKSTRIITGSKRLILMARERKRNTLITAIAVAR
jgi:hypothetical protein